MSWSEASLAFANVICMSPKRAECLLFGPLCGNWKNNRSTKPKLKSLGIISTLVAGQVARRTYSENSFGSDAPEKYTIRVLAIGEGDVEGRRNGSLSHGEPGKTCESSVPDVAHMRRRVEGCPSPKLKMRLK